MNKVIKKVVDMLHLTPETTNASTIKGLNNVLVNVRFSKSKMSVSEMIQLINAADNAVKPITLLKIERSVITKLIRNSNNALLELKKYIMAPTKNADLEKDSALVKFELLKVLTMNIGALEYYEGKH